MAFDNGNGLSAADMAAVMRGGNNNGGWGNDGFGAWWIILFMLFAFMGNGNWGNNGGGNGGGGYVGAVPYIGATADIQRGFDQQATSAGIASLQAQVGNGFADAAVANCQGNANIVAAITNGNYATAQAITGAKDTINGTLYANQLANNQTMNSLAMNLQNCCCENKAGLADLKYTVATENCADRQVVSDGIRDVITAGTTNTQSVLNGLNEVIRSQQQGTQSLLDKLCQLELDGVKQENERLRTQLNMATLNASQTAQTAQILQGQTAQAQYITSTCCPKPQPAYVVPNPNCCGNYSGGCGCGA